MASWMCNSQHMMCLMDRIVKTSIKTILVLCSLAIISLQVHLHLMSSYDNALFAVNAWSVVPSRLKFHHRQHKKQLYYQLNSQPSSSTPLTTHQEGIASGQQRHQTTTPAEIESSFQYNQSHNKLDNLRILLIDNHDSYTYNLYQYLSTMTTHPVKVVMNDAFGTLDDFLESLQKRESGGSSRPDGDTKNILKQHFDCIILSPGPGQPSHPSDMGIVLDTIRHSPEIPILGVCLGHQALGHVYGNQVKLAPCGPVHGLMSSVHYNSKLHHHDNSNKDTGNDDECKEQFSCNLFHGIDQDFKVVRYHSLVVDFPDDDDDDASDIEEIAWCKGLLGKKEFEDDPTDDVKICMALRHKQYPHYGVQFHPESIGTGEAGYQLIWNFCDFAHQYKMNGQIDSNEGFAEKGTTDAKSSLLSETHVKAKDTITLAPSRHRVFIHKLEQASLSSQSTPEEVFGQLFSSRENSFWLDSSTGQAKVDAGENHQGCPIISNSRFSIMGSDDGSLSQKIEYYGTEHSPEKQGLRVMDNDGTTTIGTDILSYLRQTLLEDGGFSDVVHMVSFSETEDAKEAGQTIHAASANELPFDYRGGYVGFLGYELRHITQCSIFEQEGGDGCPLIDSSSEKTTNPNVPTAAFFFADRSLIFDHHTGDWYIVGVANNDQEVIDDTLRWMRSMQSKIEAGAEKSSIKSTIVRNTRSQKIDGIEFVPNRSKDQYQMDIARSHEEIRNGESYELCVTNQLEAEINLPKRSDKKTHESPFDLYKTLRTNNPAPFSAFMNFHRKDAAFREASASLSICCSSPERFLSVKQDQRHQNFVVESKPIKGTIARHIGVNGDDNSSETKAINDRIIQQLKESTKDQAENLMIVDLLRNDLGSVCDIGSVHVPYLMNIESFATVHQMVSTVRGTLDGKTSNAIDVIEACFPGGSMTGAPKQRTMEILNEIEEGVSRGPYSGSLGYISLNGCMDMNIIIRSAILTPIPTADNSTESWKASIGCGGAITALSNSNDEYDEMLLKSRIVRQSISQWAQEYSSRGNNTT